MLANNSVTHDTRVIKCAESLAESNFDVTVLCKKEGSTQNETKQGVQYERRQFISTPKDFLKKIWLLFSKQPKKGLHFSCKTLGLLLVVLIFDILAAAILLPLGIIEQKLFRKNASVCIRQFKSLIIKQLLHTYISYFTFLSLYEPLLKHKPDIIHAHDIDTLMLAAVVAKAYGIPYIYDAHEYECDRVDRKGIINQLLIRFDEAKYIKKARVITVSDGIAELLAKSYSIQKPIVTYNAPVTTMIPTLKQPTIKNVLKLQKSDFLLVYVGFVTVTRCLPDIVKALSHTKKVHFACIGPQYQPMVEELHSLAASINKADYFHLLPAVPYHEVSHFISSADASVVLLNNLCTSYEHAMPNKFFETLCAGLPMVMSNQKEMCTLAEQLKLGVFVKDTSPKEIAKAISKLQLEYESYKPSTERTKALRAEFGWEAQEKKLLSLYNTLCVKKFTPKKNLHAQTANN